LTTFCQDDHIIVHQISLEMFLVSRAQFWALFVSKTGLPDGLFSNQKSPIWVNLEGLAMENVDKSYDHLVYFTAIGNI
jgi:hypothetical protein